MPVYDGTEGAVPETKAACVEWRIATDEELNNVVDQGRGYTTSDVDYTVKVKKIEAIDVTSDADGVQFEAKGLQPFTTYYYQFNVCDSDKVSLVGRTRTLPARSQKVPRDVNFAVYSCSNYRKSLCKNMQRQHLTSSSRGILQCLRQYRTQGHHRLCPAPRRLHLRVPRLLPPAHTPTRPGDLHPLRLSPPSGHLPHG